VSTPSFGGGEKRYARGIGGEQPERSHDADEKIILPRTGWREACRVGRGIRGGLEKANV